MSLYKLMIRPLLFSLPPEQVHRIAEFVLKRRALWKWLASYYQIAHPGLRTSMAGIDLPNPVGVAAGYDKNCEYLPSLMRLGFGYVVGGTVIVRSQDGNPRPRLIRYASRQSLVNAMGFPSKGAKAIIRNLEKSRERTRPLILSVAGLTVEEYFQCFRLMEPWADGIELNISSPNTADLRVFQEPEALRQLLERLNDGRRKPLFVKIPPYTNDEERQRVLELVHIARRMEIDGITAANTMPVQEPRLRVGAGGLSGKAIYGDTLRIVAEVRQEVGDSMIINACGGIFTAEDALRALQCGANTVQIFTGLVYEGPTVARAINVGLRRYLNQKGLPSLRELPGVNS